ncbi:MAG: guanylate kinase [Spirochaetales bacterium]|nr:guanylate kinase [Spirochaetales bacterium]
MISSVSGGGKTSIIRLLRRMHPELHVAVTATSRAPRPGEEHGVDYFFLSAEEFKAELASGGFLEHARVHGNYYGVPRRPVEERLSSGQSVILNIDVQGMRSVRQALGDQTISFFILPPGPREWEERLRSRGTDSQETIERRLKEGRFELSCAGEFDHTVLNRVLEEAAGEISAILVEEGVLPGA